MKAVRIHVRGGPDKLLYEEAPVPAVPAGYALVRVRASGVTPTELSWGATYTTCDGRERVPSIPGHELSGIVEQLSLKSDGIKVGDEVYALSEFCRDGSAAEYVAVKASDLAHKPRRLNHVQAAAVPLSGLTAWQALFVHASLCAGDRILIHGAAGGVGTYAVQLAKWGGAHVIATASAHNFDFLRALGADELIDYHTTRFEEAVHEVDFVLDTVGGGTLERSWNVLRPGGILVTVAGSAPLEKAAAHRVFGVDFIVAPSREQLIILGGLISSGKLRPVVEKVWALQDAREAFERGLQGHTRGKLVLHVPVDGEGR
jgi:NADPH:quinone reductase-like Zn-dependent oxidoreductase